MKRKTSIIPLRFGSTKLTTNDVMEKEHPRENPGYAYEFALHP